MNNNTPLSLFSGNTSDVSNRARVAGQFLVDETLGDTFLDLDSTNNGRLQLKDSTKVPIKGKNNIQLFNKYGDDEVFYRNLNSLNDLNKVSNLFLNGSHSLSSELYNKKGLYYSIINGYGHQILYDDTIDNKNSPDGSSCNIEGVFINGYENILKNFSVCDTIVNGTSNELNLYIYGSTITGGANTVAYLSDTVINGTNNTISECNNSIINGRGNYSSNLCYVENENDMHAESGGLDVNRIYNDINGLSYPLRSSSSSHPLEFGPSLIDNTIVTGRNNKLYMVKNSLIAGYELLIGNNTYSISDSLIFGCFNEDIGIYTAYKYMHDPIFIMGNGSYDEARSNLAVFREDKENIAGIQFAATVNSNGADYAEMFEWEDGNETDESREGLFVTLDGDKIKIANERIFVESDDDNYSLREDYNNDTYILGVVSANPAMLGDSYFGDVWKDKFVRDQYGRYVYDGEGKKILNPEYDPTKTYVDRRKRKEWDAVGLIGKLLVKDDGTCEPKKFCKVGHNGKATKSDDNTGWYVMKRINENLIQILFK